MEDRGLRTEVVELKSPRYSRAALRGSRKATNKCVVSNVMELKLAQDTEAKDKHRACGLWQKNTLYFYLV